MPGTQGVNGTPYPYVRFYQFRDGSWVRQDETPDNTSRGHGSITGTYKETDASGAHKELNVSYDHSYTQLGTTVTVENNHDHKIGGSAVHRITADQYQEHGGDHMMAIAGEAIHAASGAWFLHSTNGTQITSTGDHVTDHNDGSHYINVANNEIKFIQGVKYLSVGQDYGVYCPNGNFDQNISANCNFQSNTKITIKVQNTVITILPNSVIIHDGNGNEVGMTASQMWVGNPNNYNIPVYLGGNGQNTSLYAPVATMKGPSINVQAKYVQGTG